MIETERLQLIPLTPDQLRLWVTDMAELESELGVAYNAEPMEGIFLKIVEGHWPPYVYWADAALRSGRQRKICGGGLTDEHTDIRKKEVF